MVKFLWLLFSLFIFYGILIPFRIDVNTGAILSNIEKITWIPFIDPDGTRASIPDIIQNIFFFFPFGFLGFLSRPGSGIAWVVLVTGLGALFSGGMETLQIFTADRTASATDLVTNTLGAFMGALAAHLSKFLSLKAAASHFLQPYRENRFLYPLFIAGAVVVLSMLQPFDFTLDVGSVGSKVLGLLRMPYSLPLPFRDEGIVILQFVLLSYMWVRLFQSNGVQYGMAKGIFLSIGLGVCLECCQSIVSSRMPNVQDMIVIMMGGLSGGLLIIVRDAVRIPLLFWRVFFFGFFIAGVAIHLLSPFRLAAHFKFINLIPFFPYYERTTFLALSNAIESILIFFPLGFWGQYLFKSPRVLSLVIMSLIIAVSLELAQGGIAGRYPDITDILGALAGTSFGLWCYLRGWPAFKRIP